MSRTKNDKIKHAKLHWSDQSEPYSTLFDDIYFNSNQGLNESQYVFIDGNDLHKRWNDYKKPLFCIAETGFCSGLNFINTVNNFLSFKQQQPQSNLQRLHFISFEKYPLTTEDIVKSLQHFPQCSALIQSLVKQYPLPLIGCHRLSFNQGQIVLDLWFGDINEQIENISERENGIVDAWYLDGFNPNKNPEMWQQRLFEKMQEYSSDGATLATFTAAGFVRRALNAAGFNVKKRKGYGKKREMLVATISRSQPTSQSTVSQKSTISDIAIIGGGIATLCGALSLAKRGDKLTIYCADKALGEAASGNRQGALYPLLNQQHDELSQLFSNAYLYALNFYQALNEKYPFAHQFNGLIQLAYDQHSTNKLKKIEQTGFPLEMCHWVNQPDVNQLAGVNINQAALYYPLAGWLSPSQLIKSLHSELISFPNVTIHYNHKIDSIEKQQDQWLLTKQKNNQQAIQTFTHHTLIIAAGIDTLEFKQCRAIPLSAARGQVSHIQSTPTLKPLKRTLCHEGYITPELDGIHCMGATFKRHQLDHNFRQNEQIENLDKIKKCIPQQAWVESIKVNDQAHTAIRCTTRDHFPYVGQLTDYDQLKSDYQTGCYNAEAVSSLENIYLFTGLGSRGLCSAPLLGEIMASEIHQESLPIAKNILEKMKIPRQWIRYINKNKMLKE